MTQQEQQVLNTLLELEGAVARMKTEIPRPNLLPIFARLDSFAQSLPPGTDPLLLHYLRKKSYEKARLFLQGRDSENAAGNCHGHVE